MIGRCGVRYALSQKVHPPRHAKWAVYYWEYVVFHTTKSACDATLGNIGYYQAEDAQIVRLK
jgi:hypothetical protein